jgi:hypothetical protein
MALRTHLILSATLSVAKGSSRRTQSAIQAFRDIHTAFAGAASGSYRGVAAGFVASSRRFLPSERDSSRSRVRLSGKIKPS